MISPLKSCVKKLIIFRKKVYLLFHCDSHTIKNVGIRMGISWVILLVLCSKPPEARLDQLGYNYFMIYPRHYDSTRTWPLIFFLHGRGGGTTDYNEFSDYGLGDYADSATGFEFFVAAPQTWDDWEIFLLDSVLLRIKERFPIDTNRIYLTGFSMGGNGCYRWAIEHPDLFAALAPVAGWGIPSLACTLKDVPVWAFHDEGDPIIPYGEAREMIDSLLSCGADARLTTYNNQTHNAWTETYHNAELYQWFLSHTRSGSAQ